MRKFLQILIINIALFFVPITANATTIALHKTEIKSHEKKHQFWTKSDSNAKTSLMRFFFISGLLFAFMGWRIFYFVLPSTAGLGEGLALVFLGFGSVMSAIIFLLIGIVLWLDKMSKEENQRRKKVSS